jgi:hypothetical protein
VEYWIDRVDLLPHEDATEAWERAQRFGLKMDVERPRVKRTQRDTVEDLPPSSRKRAVKAAIARLTEAERDKYVFDNVEQSDQLAEDLQYLVGKEYFDDENGIKYKVDSVEFDAAFVDPVIGYRRALDGKLHAHDDSPQLVYGDGGLLQLVDLWGIDDGKGDVRWPENDQEWAQAQRA